MNKGNINIENITDTLLEMNRRLSKVEQRVIDLIVPIQEVAEKLVSTDINELINVLKAVIEIHGYELEFDDNGKFFVKKKPKRRTIKNNLKKLER